MGNALYTSCLTILKMLVIVKKAYEVEEDNVLHKKRSRLAGRLHPWKYSLTGFQVTCDQYHEMQEFSLDTFLGALLQELGLFDCVCVK